MGKVLIGYWVFDLQEIAKVKRKGFYMNRESHSIYNKAVVALCRGDEEVFSKIFNSLDLTRKEKMLLQCREMIERGMFAEARRLLLKVHVSDSHFVNGERALLLGTCYSQLHDTLKCRLSYSAALKEYVLCQDRKGQFLSHLLLGKNLLEGGLTPLAITHLKQAQPLAVSIAEKFMLTQHFVKLYLKTGNEAKAKQFAEAIVKQSGNGKSAKESELLSQFSPTSSSNVQTTDRMILSAEMTDGETIAKWKH